MNSKLLLIIVVLALCALAVFLIVRKKNSAAAVSCSQNVGPFGSIGQPDITKPDIANKVQNFYELCLKKQYPNGYLVTPNNGNSESQAYALLQSYLAGDKVTFGNVLDWTNRHIKRSGDNLFAWKFDVRTGSTLFEDDSTNVLDQNSATDADTDIAYALFKAGSDWNNQGYIDEAKNIANDIWNIETAQIGNKRYLLAGPWANQADSLVVNPSYISPSAYRQFARFDANHDWLKLASDSYDLLSKVSVRNSQNLVIVPNWIVVSKNDGSLSTFQGKSDSLDYSYDAFRIFWRVAQDQLNSPNSQSWNYISSVSEFENDWKKNQQVCALYIYKNGQYSCDNSTTATLAAPIGVFSVTNGYLAAQVIQKYYIRNGTLQFPDTDYFAQSWHWFAAWLWSHS